MRTRAHSSTAYRGSHQRGQAMTEYLVIGGALALALFIPVPGSQPSQSVAQMAAGSIHDFYLYLTFFLSLP